MTRSIKWRSPSNIALVKYWGKYEGQLPANPSISFTLNKCYTETELILEDKKTNETFDFEIQLDGEITPSFRPKINSFFSRIEKEVPFIKDYHLSIRTHNSFPHSSGIASSASGMSALALCLLSLKEEISGRKEDNFFQKASIWARIGSGSASRSVYGGLVEWGRTPEIEGSSDEFAVPYTGKVADVFKDFRDYVLLVETGSKKVSSSAGHGLMNDHPYSERRFLQAHQNLHELMDTFASGDIWKFGQMVESEALTLHAMMMTSRPYFILMKPNTVSVIEEVWQFREETKLPLFFTLDAGANVHLLFPEKIEQSIKELVKEKLSVYLKNGQYICDGVGSGPAKMN